MQKLDTAARTAMRETVSELRESLFALAEDSAALPGCLALQDLLQRANYNLGQVQCELAIVPDPHALIAA